MKYILLKGLLVFNTTATKENQRQNIKPWRGKSLSFFIRFSIKRTLHLSSSCQWWCKPHLCPFYLSLYRLWMCYLLSDETGCLEWYREIQRINNGMFFKPELIKKGCIPLGWCAPGSVIQDLSGSWCIKETDESILVMYSSVSSMHYDLDRSWITDPEPDHSKECSLNQENILSHLAKSDMKRVFIVKGFKFGLPCFQHNR